MLFRMGAQRAARMDAVAREEKTITIQLHGCSNI